MRYLLILSALALLISCQEETSLLSSDNSEEFSGRDWPDIDPLLIPHFINFEDEAFERGVDIDLSSSGITAVIEEIEEEDIAGRCSYGIHRFSFRDIIIDETFWERTSTLTREFIVFHELGHCYLFRDHNDSCTDRGIWESIMRSGTLEGCRDSYNNRTREAYLDELFDPMLL